MTIYNKPSDLPAWAESGDKVQPTNAEIQTGWPLSTVPPSRQRFNWVLNWLATGVRYFMQRGIPEWDATEEYPAGARVQYSGLTYVSLTGTSNTNQQPDTATTFWERWGYSETELSAFNDAYLSKSVAGGVDVTLTAAEAKKTIFNFTGVLTANINVIIPAAAKRFIVRNNTSGAFTLTVKTSGGTGVAVLQGSNTSLYCDGTNTDYAAKSGATPAQFDTDESVATTKFVQRALGNMAGVTSYSSTPVSLTAADAGKYTIFNTGSSVVNLPNPNSVPIGTKFTIECAATSITVSTPAGDIIGPNAPSAGVSSISMTDRVVMEFVVQSATRYRAYGGSGLASLATNGYQKFPSGLIIQWGGSTITAGANVAQSFALPIAFPNAALRAIASSSSPGVYAGCTAYSTTQITLFASTNGNGVLWIAIGY